jgi:hypothetical protein
MARDAYIRHGRGKCRRGNAVMRGDQTATAGNGHVRDGWLEDSCHVASKKPRCGQFNTAGYIVAATRSLL